MATFFQVFSIIAAAICCSKAANSTFDHQDLVFVNGVYNETVFKSQVAVCNGRQDEDGNVEIMTIGNDPCADANVLTVPSSMLIQFSIKQSLDESQMFVLTESARTKIYKISARIFSLEVYWRKQRPVCVEGIRSLVLGTQLWMGMISHLYGRHGYHYCHNILSSKGSSILDDVFDPFYQKHLRFKLPAVTQNNAIGAGDLIKIKTLKNQSSSNLQSRAQNLGGSFGQVMLNKSVLYNSRNQIEYPIQSLFYRNMTLRIRPKYLRRITKIYLYESKDFSLSDFADLVTKLVADPNNEVLHLSSNRMSIDTLCISQMKHKRNYDNLILDIGVFSFTFFVDSEDKKVITSQILVALGSLPLRINQQIWERVMKKMRLNSHPNHYALLKKINGCIQGNFEKLMAVKLQHYSNDSVKELVQGFVEKVMKDLRKWKSCLLSNIQIIGMHIVMSIGRRNIKQQSFKIVSGPMQKGMVCTCLVQQISMLD